MRAEFYGSPKPRKQLGEIPSFTGGFTARVANPFSGPTPPVFTYALPTPENVNVPINLPPITPQPARSNSNSVQNFTNWTDAIANAAGAFRRLDSTTPLQAEIARAQLAQGQGTVVIAPNGQPKGDGRPIGDAANDLTDFVQKNALVLGGIGVAVVLFMSGRKK